MRKVITIVVIGVLLLFNFSLIEGSYQSFKKLQEINQEQGKVGELQLKNQELKQELKLRESNFYIEQEARNRLSYSKPGETTIVIENKTLGQSSAKKEEKLKSNWESWLELVQR